MGKIKYALLQKQCFEDRKKYQIEFDLLAEQRELDKEMDLNKIAELNQKLKRMSVISTNSNQSVQNAANNMTNQQMYNQQMMQYQHEQYLRKQQWLNYQQQQQQ